jgi:hypothetical protein
MKGQAGKMWLYVEGNKRIPWLEKTGIPLIEELSGVMPNDCVMLAGKPLDKTRQRGRSQSTHPIYPWLMNEKVKYVSDLTEAETQRRLRREGMPVQLGVVDPNGKRISVAVWGLDAVEMRRVYLDSQTFNGITYGSDLSGRAKLSIDHALWKPAERISVRALYVLGLDFGQVELMLSDQGRLIVTGISPFMNIAFEDGEQRLAEALSTFASDWAKETADGVQATLGADPEFILLSPEGRVVPASRYFSPEGAAGCDSVRIRGERRWPLVELRPRPSLEPADVTADVRRLLGVASQRTAGVPLSWRAGASPVPGLPLGGHLHLSGMALTGERLRALDNAVALPLRLLEPAKAAKRRPRYGSLGDFRRQPHGGFEYRTPPSWLVSPRLALGAFALAKVAAEHSRELSFGRPLDEDRYRDAFYDGDRSLLLQAAEDIYRAISRTTGYAAYRQPIDFLFDAIARHRSWDESADIRVKWRIPLR